MPVKPPPTTTTSAVTSPCNVVVTGAAGAVFSQSPCERGSFSMLLFLPGGLPLRILRLPEDVVRHLRQEGAGLIVFRFIAHGNAGVQDAGLIIVSKKTVRIWRFDCTCFVKRRAVFGWQFEI